MDPLSGGILGSLLGGAFRLAPELMKVWDRKNERKHELEMFKESAALEKIKGDARLSEINAGHDRDVDVGVLDAFKLAVQSQTDLVKSASDSTFGKFIAAVSASVRPFITYWILAIYTFIHIYVAFSVDVTGVSFYKLVMTTDFVALVSGIINYWFLDRTLAKRGL